MTSMSMLTLTNKHIVMLIYHYHYNSQPQLNTQPRHLANENGNGFSQQSMGCSWNIHIQVYKNNDNIFLTQD